jgi:hypothetical protein
MQTILRGETFMNTPRKFWLVLIGAILTMAVIACSCGSLTPTPTVSSEPVPGLAGKWRDTAENDVHTIKWDGSKYVVVSTVSDAQGAYTVSQQSWDGSRLSWTYEVSSNSTTVDIWTISVSGNNLDIGWSSSNGGSGTDTFTREP